jgi:outer membrane protein OmpA-like peptidoglycan-associated protein
VKDAKDTSKLLSAQITIQDEEKKKGIKVVECNKKDGKYIVILNKGFTYDFSVNKKGYTFYSDRIDLHKIDKYEELQKDILLEPIQAGTSFILNNLLFKYKSFKLKKSSKYELIRIINILNSNPRMVVEIGGHTDNIGSPEYNMELSNKRVGSVVKYLIKYGAEKKQIKAKGYGMTKPLAENTTEEGRKKNRRVEMKILSVD